MCEESEAVKAVVSSEAKVVVSTNAAGDAARENGGRQEEVGGGAVSKSAMGEDAKLGVRRLDACMAEEQERARSSTALSC